jgi:hypothetical protein
MTTTSLEEQLAVLDSKLRAWTLPAHIARDIERGEEARREHERQKTKLMKERAELAEAMKMQLSADEFERRKRERAAEEQATAAAQAALREAVAQYLDAHEDICVNLRRAAEATTKAPAAMDVVGKLAATLNETGRRPDAANTLELATSLALLIPWAYRKVPGHRHRLGPLTWPSASEARHPDHTDPVEAEKKRMAAQILPLAQG